MTTRRLGAMGECDARTQGARIGAPFVRPRTPQRGAQRVQAARASLRQELLASADDASGRAEDRRALERRHPQLGGQPAEERVDEEELVQVELPWTAGGREPGLDLERRAASGWQRPLCRHPAARDEDGADVARLAVGREDAALEPLRALEAPQLPADPLERGHAVAEPAGILESPRVGQLAQAAPEARESRLRAGELVGHEGASGQLSDAARAQGPDRRGP